MDRKRRFFFSMLNFTGTRAISGTAKPGTVLGSIDTGTSDTDGDAVTVSYQWQADGANIFGATTDIYTVISAEKEKSLVAHSLSMTGMAE